MYTMSFTLAVRCFTLHEVNIVYNVYDYIITFICLWVVCYGVTFKHLFTSCLSIELFFFHQPHQLTVIKKVLSYLKLLYQLRRIKLEIALSQDMGRFNISKVISDPMHYINLSTLNRKPNHGWCNLKSVRNHTALRK